MVEVLRLLDISITVERRSIRHLHLSVYPPDGRVRIAAPERMLSDAIRLFAIQKMPWIRRQREKLHAQRREPVLQYVERESHCLWGRRYLLSIKYLDAPPAVRLKHLTLELTVRPGATAEQRAAVLQAWQRTQLRDAVQALVERWSPRLRVRVARIFLQRMRTKWGSCNAEARHIRINTELVKKPPQCLEYVVLHEMAHLRYPNHGPRFIALLDELMPNWREVREQLNELPIAD